MLYIYWRGFLKVTGYFQTSWYSRWVMVTIFNGSAYMNFYIYAVYAV